jgi:Spy/CpxP family protein refolding chaperone
MDHPWKVVFAFVGVFIAGSVFGGLFVLRVDSAHPSIVAKKKTSESPPQPQMLRRIVERLELTPEQNQTLRPLMERTEEDLRRVSQTSFRETNVILERWQEDVVKVLTPEQRGKLDEVKQELRERFRKLRAASPEHRNEFAPGGREGPREHSKEKNREASPPVDRP